MPGARGREQGRAWRGAQACVHEGAWVERAEERRKIRSETVRSAFHCTTWRGATREADAVRGWGEAQCASAGRTTRTLGAGRNVRAVEWVMWARGARHGAQGAARRTRRRDAKRGAIRSARAARWRMPGVGCGSQDRDGEARGGRCATGPAVRGLRRRDARSAARPPGGMPRRVNTGRKARGIGRRARSTCATPTNMNHPTRNVGSSRPRPMMI